MFKCSICNATLSSLPALSFHKKKHKEQEKGYECPECGKLIIDKTKLSVHSNSVKFILQRITFFSWNLSEFQKLINK